MKRGLALEGGGARGAYHLGVVKAFIKHGYQFDGYVGTSIGAINAAILAQGDFDKALELWQNISMEQIFDIEEQQLLNLFNINELKFSMQLPTNISKALIKIIGSNGINTEKMKNFLSTYLDENKIRTSGKDFGLVTVSINKHKPYELMLEDIPEKELIDYIMASSTLPGFKLQTINKIKFLDGGFYNNCPVNLLIDRNYDEIIAIRTNAPGITHKLNENPKVKVIAPKESLGSIIIFNKKNSEINIKHGYYDGLRFIKQLRGVYYYINHVDSEYGYQILNELDAVIINEIANFLDIDLLPYKRLLFEKIIPKLSNNLRLEKNFDYTDFIIGIIEYLATEKGVERYYIYDLKSFYFTVKNTESLNKETKILTKLTINNNSTNKKQAIELLFNNLTIY